MSAMHNAAVIHGNYADMRFVKTRKVAAITIEIPIERAAEFVKLFGAPDPGAEIPVAIARLNAVSEAEPAKAEKPKRSWAELPPAQQCAIRCGEPAFWKWLEGQFGPITPMGSISEESAAIVRPILGIGSRAELNENEAAALRWRRMDDAYVLWTRGIE